MSPAMPAYFGTIPRNSYGIRPFFELSCSSRLHLNITWFIAPIVSSATGGSSMLLRSLRICPCVAEARVVTTMQKVLGILKKSRQSYSPSARILAKCLSSLLPTW